MTAKELIEWLRTLPPETVIGVSDGDVYREAVKVEPEPKPLELEVVLGATNTIKATAVIL